LSARWPLSTNVKKHYRLGTNRPSPHGPRDLDSTQVFSPCHADGSSGIIETMTLTATAPEQSLKHPFVHLSTDFIRAKEYLEAIVSAISDAVCTTDLQGNLIYFSPGAEALLRMRAEEAIGVAAHHFYAEGRAEADKIADILHRRGSVQNHELLLKTADGRLIHATLCASLLRDRTGRVIGTLSIAKDITGRVELENRLRELSITDNLTGLYNQRHFHERLAQEASRARRQGENLSLILMDLDNFKRVNDTWGHWEGDRMLKAFAGAVAQGIRKEVDAAFRYGGDEFVVLFPGLAGRAADKVARRIVALARASIAARGIGCSYGVATLARGGTADLIRKADRRMFAMKSLHRETAAPRRPVSSLAGSRGV